MKKLLFLNLLLWISLAATPSAFAQTDVAGTTFAQPSNLGAFHVYTCANPAAGSEFTCTVPTGKIWLLMGLQAQLVTSATANNRVVSILADDGTNVFVRSTGNVNQAATITANYSTTHCSGLSSGTVGPGGDIYSPWPCEMLLGPGYRIRSSTALFDAGGDDWGAPVLFVIEWSK